MDEMFRKLSTAVEQAAKVVQQDAVYGAKFGSAKVQELNAEQRRIRAVYNAGLRAYELFRKGMITDSQLRAICSEISALETDIRKYQSMAKNFARHLKLR